MDDGQSPRLYREQRPNPGTDPVTAAVTTMVTEPPVDIDYYSPWPKGTKLLDESVAGDTATVDLSKFPSPRRRGRDGRRAGARLHRHRQRHRR